MGMENGRMTTPDDAQHTSIGRHLSRSFPHVLRSPRVDSIFVRIKGKQWRQAIMPTLQYLTLQACMLRLLDLGGGGQGNPVESTYGSLLDMG